MRRLTLVLVCGIALGGCTHHNDIAKPAKPGAEREETGQEAKNERAAAEAKKKIPEQDRITYYQLGDAGSLARRVGIGQAPDQERIKFAVARLKSLHPADKGLDGARKQLIDALEPIAEAGGSIATVTDEDSATAAANAALKALNRYGGKHPAVFGLVPD